MEKLKWFIAQEAFLKINYLQQRAKWIILLSGYGDLVEEKISRQHLVWGRDCQHTLPHISASMEGGRDFPEGLRVIRVISMTFLCPPVSAELSLTCWGQRGCHFISSRDKTYFAVRQSEPVENDNRAEPAGSEDTLLTTCLSDTLGPDLMAASYK